MVYKIENFRGHFRVTEYKDRFKGLFLSETGYVAERDSCKECREWIAEREEYTKEPSEIKYVNS